MERPADLASDGGTDGNVLQVRIAAAQPPGRRHGLVERRVQASRFGIDELRQRVDVGALELREAAPLQDLARQVVHQGQLLEHVHRRGGRFRLAGALAGRKLQLLEEDGRELPRRVDVEGLAGQGVDLGLQRRQLRVHRRRLRGQRIDVEPDPRAFQIRQHWEERQLEVAVERLEPVADELPAEPIGHLQPQVALLAGVLEQHVHRHVGGADRFRTLADDLLERDRLVAHLLEGEVAEVVTRSGGVDEIAGEQGVDIETVEGDPVAVKHERRRFEVVSDLRNPGVGQHAREGTERFFTPDLAIRSQRPVSERYVAGVTRTGRKGDSHQVGTHGVR